ncbi:MAG: gluconolactonase [Planctomycetaceae bacterium]|nr:gluconolactonase [Planctomycetaceae bacterium]
MQEYECELLFRPDSDALRFLPEGPYPYGANRFSWVAIQHGSDQERGSLNVYDFADGSNKTFELQGRPGFAFPTDRQDTFVVGLERRVVLVDLNTGDETLLCDGVDNHVENTIINDGMAFDGGLIFGSKELTFSKTIAGLYLYRSADRQLITLRTDQICSNGKALVERNGQLTLIDIDSPTKTVVGYPIDVEAGTLGEKQVLLDFTAEEIFPDGMILTPDGTGVIIAFYNPNDADYGVARQHNLETRKTEAIWRTAKAPQCTCPQLLELDGAIKLVLTTAVEHMTTERQQQHSNSGSLFIGDTNFSILPETPTFTVGN